MVSQKLEETIPILFNSSQQQTACHRKNAVQLRKLLSESYEKTGSLDDFTLYFIPAVHKILAVKKKEPTAEKSMKFVSAFLAFLQEKGICIFHVSISFNSDLYRCPIHNQ